MEAIPQAAFFLLLESAAGGSIALFWVHLRGEVSRGFTLFTGACLLVAGALAIWLRSSFPPSLATLDAAGRLWFQAERVSSLAFALLFAVCLIVLRSRPNAAINRWLAPLVPLLALASLWSAGLVAPSGQLFGLGAPLAVLAGALALGAGLTGLSLGHWYLVTPTMSVRPLIRLTWLCIGAIVAQGVLLLPLLVTAPAVAAGRLLNEYALFFGVRVVFGLVVPLIAAVMTWRTARIRSLDSATGLLYIVAALIFAGEITARALYFLTGVAT